MAGRKSDFTLPTLDDLFSTQEMRDDAKLAKIRDIPLELIRYSRSLSAELITFIRMGVFGRASNTQVPISLKRILRRKITTALR